MTEREMVIAHLTERMIAAFANGEFVDARNINIYLSVMDAEEPFDSRKVKSAA